MMKKSYVFKKYWLFQYYCSTALKGKSIRKEIPASFKEVTSAQNAREQKFLVDYNWMYTDFIKAHDGPTSSRLKEL